MADVFDEIRAACREVTEGARHLRLIEARVAELAARLPPAPPQPGLDPAFHWLGHGEGTAVFVLLLDAVNFGSGWSKELRKPAGLSTYFTTAAALKGWFEREGVPAPARVAALRADELAAIFGQEAGATSPVRGLLELWARSLSELALLVELEHAGDWLGPVRAAEGHAARLVARLGTLPSWHDVAAWGGRAVPLFKRAQITCADLHHASREAGAADGAWWGRWRDLPRLTAFADNVVPHVLRVEGVLEYAPELAARVDEGRALEPGSEEEVEIRAAGVQGVELLVAALKARGGEATAMGVDQLLWQRGRSSTFKSRRSHRTKTSFY
jgi:hypothetical protein